MREQPDLTFFCELETPALRALLGLDSTEEERQTHATEGRSVIETLQAMKAGISMGLLDLSPERAAVVRNLNEAGIPLTAWLLLPREAGYWLNVRNVNAAIAFYERFYAWTVDHDLKWERVGLDIEPHIEEMEQWFRRPWQVLPRALGRLLRPQRLAWARAAYQQWVERIHRDGYEVETYMLPWVVDERRMKSTFLQRVLGTVDVAVDREVLMLYSSFLDAFGPGMLWSYAPSAQSIGVGSTGGGVSMDGVPALPTLSWEALTRDLRLAHRWSDDVHIFSLEGAVAQGYLPRLMDFDWDRSVDPPLRSFRQVDRVRAGLQVGLWTARHPWFAIAVAAGIGWLIRSRKKRST